MLSPGRSLNPLALSAVHMKESLLFNRSVLSAVCAVFGWIASGTSAQCPAWREPSEFFYFDGRVYDYTEWTPPGSDEPWVIAAGAFELAGSVHAHDIAAWDGDRWRPLGSALDERRVSFSVHTFEGDVYVGGGIDLSRWNGSEWIDLGLGLNGNASSMLTFEGDLVIAGGFSTVGGATMRGIARWDGQTWSPFGEGFSEFVNAAVVWQDKLVAAGRFTSSDGVTLNRVAWWDGTSWQPFGDGFDSVVEDAFVLDGELYCAGSFRNSGGEPLLYIARWDGLQWQQVGSDLPSRATTLGSYAGDLYIGGSGYRLRWTGTEWVEFGGGSSGNMFVMREAGGKLYMDGTAKGFQCWDGQELVTFEKELLDDGDLGSIYLAHSTAEGLIVAGWFTEIVGVPIDRVAIYRNGQWSPFGTWPDIYFPRRIFEWNGDLYAHSNTSVAMWDGTDWVLIGRTTGGSVVRLVAYDGKLVGIGTFTTIDGVFADGMVWWDGAQWHPFGEVIGSCYDAAVYRGDLVIAGGFTMVDGLPIRYIARHDGTTWHQMGWAPDDYVTDLVVHNDRLVAAGYFSQIGGAVAASVAEWDGAAWRRLGDGLPPYGGGLWSEGGELYAADEFEWRDRECSGVVRWTGERWDCVVSASGSQNGRVLALAHHDNKLYYAGTFKEIDYEYAPTIGYLTSPDPVILGQSGDLGVPPGQDALLFVEADAPREPRYTWRRNGQHLSNGPTGHGSEIYGVSGPELRVLNASADDEGLYDCVVANACATVISEPIGLAVVCAADFNADGAVDTRDVIDYLGAWVSGDSSADTNGDGVVDTRDFVFFLNTWTAGC